MTAKTFDTDLQSPSVSGTIDWVASCKSYPNVWNKYQIEIVSETDALSDFWFTEKTAKCLSTGKPFVLVAGRGSLARLKSMGFYTFSDIIDEEYDNELTPTRRINRLINSLKVLYNDPNKYEKVQNLYQIAQKNIEAYVEYSNTQSEQK
jgi:hypothetical protein